MAWVCGVAVYQRTYSRNDYVKFAGFDCCESAMDVGSETYIGPGSCTSETSVLLLNIQTRELYAVQPCPSRSSACPTSCGIDDVERLVDERRTVQQDVRDNDGGGRRKHKLQPIEFQTAEMWRSVFEPQSYVWCRDG
jgi:hypothetical protein